MQSPRRPFLEGPPLLFAHRGGAKLWPENTLLAFQGALAAGCGYLETDLHATKDGVLVLHHDETVDRTTNGQGLVRDYTLSELKRLDAGYRFQRDGETPFRGQGLTIPTLEELFGLSDGARFNIEIKQLHPTIVSRFCDFILENRLEDRVLVAAEHDVLVREFRKLCRGRVATSAGQREAYLFWIACRARLASRLPIHYDALQVPSVSRGLTVVNERFVRAAHRRGVQVHVWTVDDPPEMRRLFSLGVDGIMSDRPDLLARTAPLRTKGVPA